MPTNPPEIPADLKTAIHKALSSPAYSEGRVIANATAAEKIFHAFEYDLRMFWSGRSDKMSGDRWNMMRWITRTTVVEAGLAEETSLDSHRNGSILFRDEDHRDLARKALEGLTTLCRTSGEFDMSEPRDTIRKSWLSRLLRRDEDDQAPSSPRP
jgi:hypothetical protein